MAMFQCGRVVASLLDVQRTFAALAQHFHSLEKARDFEQRALALAMTTSLHGSAAAATGVLLQIVYHDISERAGARTELTALLGEYRSTLASDPRDKIYAALGISRNEEKIEPDYSFAVEDVYVQAAKRSIETTQSFRVLAHCRFPPTLSGLPSWVPDWTDQEAGKRVGLSQRHSQWWGARHEDKIYAAGGDLQAEFRFENHDRELIVKGINADELVFVSTGYSYRRQRDLSRSVENNSQRLEYDKASRQEDEVTPGNVLNGQWLREWAAFQSSTKHYFTYIARGDWTYQPEGGNDQFSRPNYLLSDEALGSAYLKTLAADVFRMEVPNSNELRITDKTFEGVQDMTRLFRDACVSRSVGRAFAVSKLGLFVLVPAEAQTGDCIAFMQGSEVPFILRPSAADYLFIGECYLHGLMDGELREIIGKEDRIRDLRIL